MNGTGATADPPGQSGPSYETRAIPVTVGRTQRAVLLALFPVPSGTTVGFQLADEGDLRRGGVYLVPSEGPAIAPRYDEVFRDVVAKAGAPRAARQLERLAGRAQAVARASRPRLTPTVLRRLEALGRAAAREAERLGPLPGLPLDALVVALALLFAAEEERYARPRYKGSDLLLERLVELLRAAPGRKAPAG